MSRTDKTRPERVQILDPHNRGWLAEHHDHTNGVCDIAQAYADVHARSVWRAGHSCHLWPSSVAWNSGLYPRPSREVDGWAVKQECHMRTQARAMCRELLKLTPADRYDYDTGRPRHRHGALYDIT